MNLPRRIEHRASTAPTSEDLYLMSSKKEADKFGEMLKTWRREAGLTQSQLAGLSTVSVRAIRDLELGKVQQPRRDTIHLLADALRLNGSHRTAIELAMGETSATGALKQVYNLSQAVPPASFGPFAGRQSELDAIIQLLGTKHERLVMAVVGFTGVGKTRLALEAAQVLHASSRMPVLWVYMSGSAEPAAVPQSILSNWASEVIASGGPVHELIQIIGDEPALFVVDGLETLQPVETSLMRLLHACPRLSVLATTREPSFGLCRRVLPLAPLPLPEPSAQVDCKLAADQPALTLMMSYLSHLRPDILPSEPVIAAMTRICHALDGLPQALESAASWLPLYAPHQLLEIAESSPLTLTENMLATDSHRAGSFRLSLDQSLARLHPQHILLLRLLASVDVSWTVDAVVQKNQCTPAEALRCLHGLLLRGFLRRVHHEQANHKRLTTFTVLNLVRHLVNPGAAVDQDRLVSSSLSPSTGPI